MRQIGRLCLDLEPDSGNLINCLLRNRSRNLVGTANQHQPHCALIADVLDLPHRLFYYDFAISIAVIHHLSTEERRIQALRAIIQCLKPAGVSAKGGKALIYVWALEQRDSRRGWDENHEQDVMVPWVMKKSQKKSADVKDAADNSMAQITYHRYYHLYKNGELEHAVTDAGGIVLDSGYEKDNWWAIVGPPVAE